MSLNCNQKINISKKNQDVYTILQQKTKEGENLSQFTCNAIRFYNNFLKNSKNIPSELGEDGIINSFCAFLERFADKNLSYFIPKELDSGKTTVEKVAKVFTMVKSVEVQMKNTAMIMDAVKESNVYIDSKRQATSNSKLERFSSKITKGIRNSIDKLDRQKQMQVNNDKRMVGIEEWKRLHPTLPYSCRNMSDTDLYDLEHPEAIITEET